jgi:hypothetical protein
MVRLLDDAGTVVLTHLHNLLAENLSAGMPLPPAGYRELFAGLETGVFKESNLFEALWARQVLDLSVECGDAELANEAALILVATRRPDLFRAFDWSAGVGASRRLTRNPLYAVERRGEDELWTLRFPSAGYEMEYANSRRYLPASVLLRRNELDQIRRGRIDAALSALAERRVLLDLPDGYEQW